MELLITVSFLRAFRIQTAVLKRAEGRSLLVTGTYAANFNLLAAYRARGSISPRLHDP